jgi:hypothetical protein
VVDYVFTDPPLADPTPVTCRQGDEARPEVVAEVPDEGGPKTCVFTFVGIRLRGNSNTVPGS